jgi:hypothetical protein
MATHSHHHHEMPTSGRALNQVALSATLHCLTGCAIGEVLGMIIGTALGFSELGTIALAVSLAFLFGYGLTSLPLLRAGMALSAVVPIALAADTLSIATMEIVDNGIMLAVPAPWRPESATSCSGARSPSPWPSRASSRCRSTAGSSLAAGGTPSCTKPGSTGARRRAWSGPSPPRRSSSDPPCCSPSSSAPTGGGPQRVDPGPALVMQHRGT